MIAASYTGQLVGALLFSQLAERYGRVPSAAAATAIMSVMSLGCALVGSFWWLFVCRLVQGIGVGGEMPVAAAYISELSRAQGRRRFFMLYEIIFPVGLMATGQIGTLLAGAFFVANGLNNWMPTLYHTVYGLDLRDALRAASMTNVAQVVMLILCAFTIDRVGRRNWTVGSFIVGALLLGTLAVGDSKDLTLVMLLATLAYGIIGSINAVLYLYTPEIYPTRMRAIGTGRQGIDAVFAMFTGVALIGGVAAVSMIETRSRQLEEIAP